MGHFLERGDKTTRLEAFVDAAFAFALTLLAIAGDHIPTSSDELWRAMHGLPAYAASFLLILRFWSGHVDWSRRYGLDDDASRRLGLLLVFLVLVFVYPMRIVFAELFAWISGGYFAANFRMSGYSDIPLLFLTFGVAFGSLGAVLFLLYRHAWTERDALGLGERERVELRMLMWRWAACPLAAAVSIIIALLVPARPESGWLLGLPGFVYFALIIATFVSRRVARRRLAAFPESR